MSEKTIGVILSGAGHKDGSDAAETTLCLLALDEAGVAVRAFAPDVTFAPIDALTGAAGEPRRGVLAESGRLVRGPVVDIASVKGTDLDGWLLPGGEGVARNLSDYAEVGAGASPHKEVARVVREALAAQLPIGACGVSAALLAVITKRSGPQLRLTLGGDDDAAKALRAMGAEPASCKPGEILVDEDHKVASTPALAGDGTRLADVREATRRLVSQVVDWA